MSSFAGQASTSSTSSPAYSKDATVRQPDVREASPPEQPTRPPGLLPLPGECLWKPHEDKYWSSIREMWGSNLDLTDPHDEDDLHRKSHYDNEASRHDLKREMDDVDLCTENGTVFRIVLPNQATSERDNNITTTGGRASAERMAGVPRTSINHTPLNDALAIHLPPPAAQKSINYNKGRRAFQGSVLNVSVTTTTRTYGDFSKMNPPPYTPRPTGRERSFGRNGKISAVTDEKRAKWPVAKWLFILGFVFPLLWLFSSCLLLSGLRKMSADAESEAQHTKSDTLPYDTNESVTHLIAQEVVWSKRCAWAFGILACLCIAVLGILKGLGM